MALGPVRHWSGDDVGSMQHLLHLPRSSMSSLDREHCSRPWAHGEVPGCNGNLSHMKVDSLTQTGSLTINPSHQAIFSSGLHFRIELQTPRRVVYATNDRPRWSAWCLADGSLASQQRSGPHIPGVVTLQGQVM